MKEPARKPLNLRINLLHKSGRLCYNLGFFAPWRVRGSLLNPLNKDSGRHGYPAGTVAARAAAGLRLDLRDYETA